MSEENCKKIITIVGYVNRRITPQNVGNILCRMLDNKCSIKDLDFFRDNILATDSELLAQQTWTIRSLDDRLYWRCHGNVEQLQWLRNNGFYL